MACKTTLLRVVLAWRSYLLHFCVDMCRLENQLQELQAEAAMLRSQQAALSGFTGRGAGQVEMLVGLQSLLALKLDMQKAAPRGAGRQDTQRLLSSGIPGASQRSFGMSETNVMTL